MAASINPYQPASVDVQSASAEALALEGVVEPEDYAALRPGGTWILILLLICVTGSGLLAVGAIVALLGLAATGKLVLGAIAGVAFVLLLCAVTLVFTYCMLSPAYLARYVLHRHPDLVGHVRGTVGASGIVLHDGSRTHWFSSAFLANARVSRKGIRLPVDPGDPYRYLALPARLFDGFNDHFVRRMHRVWLTSVTATTETPGIELWRTVASPPEDAIRFAGPVEIRRCVRTGRQFFGAIGGTLLILLLVAGVVTSVPEGPGGWILAGMVFLYVFGATFRAWRLILGYTERHGRQSGWLSPDELAWRCGWRGVRLPRADIISAQVDESGAILLLSRGAMIVIPPEHTGDGTTWNQLRERVTPIQNSLAARGINDFNRSVHPAGISRLPILSHRDRPQLADPLPRDDATRPGSMTSGL